MIWRFGGFGVIVFFFFNDTATTEIYTLSLHDALPICLPLARPLPGARPLGPRGVRGLPLGPLRRPAALLDRKSTRLNSSHANISYAVFCLKKKHDVFIGAIRELPPARAHSRYPGQRLA